MAVAWLFPGQGSQYVGMAAGWAAQSADARETLAESAAVLGFDLPRLISEGPESELADTYNQQPAVFAASIAILRAVAPDVPPPAFVAGHSLGEYSALVAAGALEFADGLRLVRERGRLMKLAGERSPGRMAAILGLEDAAVEEVCTDIEGVQVANYNSPGQVVISGATQGVEIAVALLSERGAARVVTLPITIAAHSALMSSVADEFGGVVAQADLKEAQVPVVANVLARPITLQGDLRTELQSQLTAPVRWTESVRFMAEQGVTEYYEIGPGHVLTGLVKRIHRADGRERPDLRIMGEPPSQG